MMKKSRLKFKYFENKKSFYDEIKNIFVLAKDFQLPKIA